MLITTPTLLLDENKCRRNIRMMVDKARRNQVVLRPHLKTPQSQAIARWLRAEGVTQITVSSIRMAAYFAEDGWTDITVAFPFNVLEMETVNGLASRIHLNLLVESNAHIRHLQANLQSPLGLFIKLNLGNHRAGLEPDDYPAIDALLAEIAASPLLKFRGFLGHAGQSYSARGLEEIAAVHRSSRALMQATKAHYQDRYPQLIVSVGDTPTCSRMEDFSGVEEIRPGNFIFYDLMQQQIGSCDFAQIAVAMACPIVAIHEAKQELLIYGGGVHFSKDRLEDPELGTIYGRVVRGEGNGWGDIIPDTYLKKVSQEHGIIKAPSTFIEQQQIGAILKILPVHSCMTADAMKGYIQTTGEALSMMQ
ncbi:MAG: alanine racemase [Bacteroidota bacterium]